jgi:hypothetical protein
MSHPDSSARSERATAGDSPQTRPRRAWPARTLRWLVPACLLAALATASGHGAQSAQSASTCHPDRFFQQRVNLDGDPAKEEVLAVDSHDCQHTSFRAYVHIHDRCHGVWRLFDLDSEANVLQQFRIVNADGRTKRPEVFFVTRTLGPVAGGIGEVVRLDDRPSGCARLRTLFRYEPKDPSLQSFDVQLKDLTPRFGGLELVLTEGKEVAQRITRYRYDRKLDRYVIYG